MIKRWTRQCNERGSESTIKSGGEVSGTYKGIGWVSGLLLIKHDTHTFGRGYRNSWVREEEKL